LGRPHGYLILPSKVEFDYLDKLEIAGEHDSSPVIMWAKKSAPGAKPGKGKFKLICFEMPPREHGLIEALPQNLAELESVCSTAGFDLRQALIDKLKSDPPAGDLSTSEFSFELLLVLHLDVTGKEHPDIVTHEEWAFMIGKALAVGEALGVMASSNGIVGPLVVPLPPSQIAIEKIQVLPIALFRRLDEKLALASSGLGNPYPPVAVIGVGSLGSKFVEILARQGLERAVLIDGDRLFPHNTARHALLGNAVGFPKAPSLAHLLSIQHDLDDQQEHPGFTSIAENFSIPTNATLDSALASSEYVLDFSASVGVSRGLSSLENGPRCFSAFLTPGADTFFVHQEDRERRTRLDWLEAITLRAIVEDEKLQHAYTRNSSQIWYGGPCREVSTVLSNQNVSLFAAAGAGMFTRRHASPLAKCIGYCLDPETMALEAVEIEATAPAVAKSNGWTVNYDSTVVNRMKSMRAAAFPKETGGVLFGVLDRERMSCSVVIASASPPDSEAWPDAYIRGAKGLRALVDRVGDLTAGQLQYVGEWHSHPSGSSSRPSRTDHEALGILTEIMGREGLPAITFIVGEEPEPCVTAGWLPQT
jgi:integrative and conjugative element protein (TIGR02256 family)